MKENYTHLISDRFEQEALREVETLLDAELARPEKDRNYDKIEALTDAYACLAADEEQLEKAAEQGWADLQKKHPHAGRPRPSVRIRLMLTAGIAAVLLLAANAFTVSALDMSLYSVIVKISNEGFSVDFTPDPLELETSPDDPYGIRTACGEHGMDVEAPTYIPEGFVLTNMDYTSFTSWETVGFWFYKGDRKICLTYTKYANKDGATGGIPCDDFNLTEVDINGKPGIVSKEDGQCTLVYLNDLLETVIYMEYLDYSECDKVIDSLR